MMSATNETWEYSVGRYFIDSVGSHVTHYSVYKMPHDFMTGVSICKDIPSEEYANLIANAPETYRELASAQRTIKVQAGILEALEAQGVSMPDKYYDLKEGKD